MRIAFVLPGLHRVHRGAEVALESIATGLASLGNDVVLVGGGPALPGKPYSYVQSGLVERTRFERAPRIPLLRDESAYEELTFAAGLLTMRRVPEADVTVSCGYPFVNWLLTRSLWGRRRPPHVHVTENGDAPAVQTRSEFRFFRCDGLVCTNPEYEQRNRGRWRTALIPNGVDTTMFRPGTGDRRGFGIPEGVPVVLIVAALIPSKRVAEGIRAVAEIPEVFLVIAGDGPLRDATDELANSLLPGRYLRLTAPPSSMPDLYRSADALLHMSRDESFGNVYVEGLCSGLPVVAHASPASRWIFGDHHGLIDTGDRLAVRTALADAITRGREFAAERAIEAAQRFAWPTIARQYEQFLAEVVAATSSSAPSSGR